MQAELEITLMRHGRSRADDEGVHEGRYDSPLTEIGTAQAIARGQALLAQGLRFDLVIASTLARAQATAQIVAEILDLPVESDLDWMEMNNGPLAGLSFAEAERRHPRPAFRNPYTPIAGSGESAWELYARAARAIESLIRRGPGSYLVVAHGGILNAAMGTILGKPPLINDTGFVFYFGDTGYARLTYAPGKHLWVLREFNAGIH